MINGIQKLLTVIVFQKSRRIMRRGTVIICKQLQADRVNGRLRFVSYVYINTWVCYT